MSAENNDNKKDAMVRKIKFLLRKAQTTTKGEMEACMAKAQELALKYQLDLASIDPNSEEFEVNETTFMENVRLNNECKYAARICQEYFNISVYYQTIWATGTNKSRQQIRVVGTDVDQALAKYVFDYLVGEFRDLWNTALKAGEYRIVDRHQFMLGLYHGVFLRLQAEKQAQVQERGLMVISNKLVQRKNFLEQHRPDLKVGKKEHVNEGDQTAYQDGVKKGRALQIRKGVGVPEKDKKGVLSL